MAETRYFARSASDRTDDWPYWFVADRQKSGLNVTKNLLSSLEVSLPDIAGLPLLAAAFALQPFLRREDAERLASRANEALHA